MGMLNGVALARGLKVSMYESGTARVTMTGSGTVGDLNTRQVNGTPVVIATWFDGTSMGLCVNGGTDQIIASTTANGPTSRIDIGLERIGRSYASGTTGITVRPRSMVRSAPHSARGTGQGP